MVHKNPFDDAWVRYIQGMMTIEVPAEIVPYHILITDILGNILYDGYSNQPSNTFDINTLTSGNRAGVYIVTLNNQQEAKTFKVFQP